MAINLVVHGESNDRTIAAILSDQGQLMTSTDDKSTLYSSIASIRVYVLIQLYINNPRSYRSRTVCAYISYWRCTLKISSAYHACTKTRNQGEQYLSHHPVQSRSSPLQLSNFALHQSFLPVQPLRCHCSRCSNKST